MTNIQHTDPQQPIIVKYVQHSRNGVQAHSYSRNCIGYVLKGKKFIHDGDLKYEVNQGEVFYLSTGNHYIEDIPEVGKDFQQILFYINNDLLGRILTNLSMNYQLTIENDHLCPNCSEKNHLICPSWPTLRNFFSTVNQYFKDGEFCENETAETLKLTELMYLIITHKDCCLKRKLVDNIDSGKEQFDQIIHSHIFSDINIESLALKCNRSLTSFKKEFHSHFHTSPHKWFVKQRLVHARLLLISTNRPIAEIGMDCNFPNTSHFIKLFKKEYAITPASFRQKMKAEMQEVEIENNNVFDDTQIGYPVEIFA